MCLAIFGMFINFVGSAWIMLKRLCLKGRTIVLSQCQYYSSLSGLDLCKLPHVVALEKYRNTAIEDVYGNHSYGSLLVQSYLLACNIRKTLDCDDLRGERIVYLTPNDSSNVVTLWAIWMNEAIAVPLCASHPLAEKQYFVDDCDAKLVIGTENFADDVMKLNGSKSTPHLIIPNAMVKSADENDLPTSDNLQSLEGVERSTNALIIYTSGTTGRPKGVVLSHGNIEATTNDMIDYWQWKSSDACLHILPLHHIHGLINALHVPLSVGAKCVMLPQFNAKEVWRRLMAMDNQISVFTAVPTVYAKLLEYYECAEDPDLYPQAIKLACDRIRVMISGSSALPLPVRDRFNSLTGHTLLERYGMSEILMALTNPLEGTRSAGTVGLPFKSVNTMIAKEDSTTPHGYIDVTNHKSDNNPDQSAEGELYVKGPTVFKEYWNKPEATKDSFTADGWFKTGDTVCLDSNGYYRVLGRTSVDILKSSGYKISALDVESKLLQHSSIAECAVIGVPHSVYGQMITALIVAKVEGSIDIESLKSWCADVMPKYSVPREFKVLGSIPKNAMGKINKKALLKQYYPDS